MKEEAIIGEIEEKIVEIENEMDVRVESLIIEIESFRDKYRTQLAQYKDNLKK